MEFFFTIRPSTPSTDSSVNSINKGATSATQSSTQAESSASPARSPTDLAPPPERLQGSLTIPEQDEQARLARMKAARERFNVSRASLGISELNLDGTSRPRNPRPADVPVEESAEDGRDDPVTDPAVEATPELLLLRAKAAAHRSSAQLNTKLLLEEVSRQRKS